MRRSGDERVCAVRAMDGLRAVAPERFDGREEAKLPLFRWQGGRVLRREEVQRVLQQAAQACGLPPERFQSHSLRIGGATALYQATGEIELVKRRGRWFSSAVQRYLHDDLASGIAKTVGERMVQNGELREKERVVEKVVRFSEE